MTYPHTLADDSTVKVAFDLSKAFDTVNHPKLFEDVAKTPLPQSLKRFIVKYMYGRQPYVEFRNKKSESCKLK